MLDFTKKLTKVTTFQNHISENRPRSGRSSKKISFPDDNIVLNFHTRPGLRTYIKITLKSGTKWIFLQRSGGK